MPSKAVILVGGPSRGTRFRPLSMTTPKPLFPIAGRPILMHHLEALSRLPDLTDVVLMGFFDAAVFADFIATTQPHFPRLSIQYAPVHMRDGRYWKEERSLGTAGGLYLFADKLRQGADAIVCLHADICSALPVQDLLAFHRRQGAMCTVMGTKVRLR